MGETIDRCTISTRLDKSADNVFAWLKKFAEVNYRSISTQNGVSAFLRKFLYLVRINVNRGTRPVELRFEQRRIVVVKRISRTNL